METPSTRAGLQSDAPAAEPNGPFLDQFDFRYPDTARVVLRAGAAAEEPPRHLLASGRTRVVVAVARSLRGTAPIAGLFSSLTNAGIEAASFCAAMQHCPLGAVTDLATMSRRVRAQAVVAVGGSSVSDTAKAACLLLAAQPDADGAELGAIRRVVDAQVPLPVRVISVPTTLSGGEFTPVVGITDPVSGGKAVLRHSGLYSELVVLDPELARLTPHRLWAATGFKLLDHAVERLLARNHKPLIDAQCLYGIQRLLPRLGHSVDSGPLADRARLDLLQILWVIQSSHGNVGTGLSHALSHQLGALYGLDHGSGSAVCLPAVLRLLAATARIEPERMSLLLQAFGEPAHTGGLDAVIARLESLRAALHLPATLAEAGLASIAVERVAEAVLDDPTAGSSPGAPLARNEVLAILRRL